MSCRSGNWRRDTGLSTVALIEQTVQAALIEGRMLNASCD
jgi:hypothetical protein